MRQRGSSGRMREGHLSRSYLPTLILLYRCGATVRRPS
jgi:hypothetical protein